MLHPLIRFPFGRKDPPKVASSIIRRGSSALAVCTRLAIMSKKILIDTDPGIDDAQALLYAMAHLGLDVVGVTTIFGNVGADLATANALRLCELAQHHDIPIAQGASVPLTIAPHPVADFVHGKNGFGEVELPLPGRSADSRSAAQLIVDIVRANPHEVTLVPVGPLTNIAAAIALDPSVVELAKGIVIMGGAVVHKGNVTPYAEANIWNDPHAAHAVLSTAWPDLVLLGLDVTYQVTMTLEYMDSVAQASEKCGGFLKATSVFYAEFYKKEHGFVGCCPHDLCALVYMAHPEFFEAKSCPNLAVVVDGEKVGQTIVVEAEGSSPPPKRYVVKVDAEKLLEDFLQTMKSLP